VLIIEILGRNNRGKRKLKRIIRKKKKLEIKKQLLKLLED
jgi:hypothetical protein